ncbi:MAG: SDR family oxidoreductase [Pseudomonadota bacterium]
MTDLAGRRAVVTGGGSGIGKAIAGTLGRAGASVTILGRNEERLRAAAAACGGLNHAPCDVTNPESVEAVFASLAAAGPIDILVNNAGAAQSAPFVKADLDHWDAMLGVNLMGVVHCMRAAAPDMRKRDYGRIVNIASTSGLRGYAYVSAYAAAKHAVIGLTRSVALEFAKTAVTVNSVCPGFTETELVEGSLDTIEKTTGRSREEAVEELVKYNPQGRLIDPDEVASAVLWLCSPEAKSITGQSIAVAGGEVM